MKAEVGSQLGAIRSVSTVHWLFFLPSVVSLKQVEALQASFRFRS